MKTEYNDDHLRKEAPKLFGMDKKNPFGVLNFDTTNNKINHFS